MSIKLALSRVRDVTGKYALNPPQADNIFMQEAAGSCALMPKRRFSPNANIRRFDSTGQYPSLHPMCFVNFVLVVDFMEF